MYILLDLPVCVNIFWSSLSVGPRNEGELFAIRSLGFKWNNIKGLDLLTYSKLTELGDIHSTNFETNSK